MDDVYYVYVTWMMYIWQVACIEGFFIPYAKKNPSASGFGVG